MAEVAPVTFGDNLPGFEIGSKTDPAIIVIQEWWGVTPVVKKQAALLSSKGYRVLIPDLYKGKTGVDAEEAHHLMENLDFKHAVTEIEQAAEYLKETGAPKIGITGFCMGGALVFASVSLIKDLQVAVACYGTPPPIFDVTQIKIPVLGIFGTADKHKGFADEETARAVESKIKAAGGDIEIKVYEGAPHGFLNQIVGPEGVEMVQKFQGAVAPQTSVEAAWNDLNTFFDKHLKA